MSSSGWDTKNQSAISNLNEESFRDLFNSQASYLSSIANQATATGSRFTQSVRTQPIETGANTFAGGQTAIESIWVKDFVGNLSVMGSVLEMTEDQTLDQLAQERFDTMIQRPEITHYGADAELPPGSGERLSAICYPAGQTPSEFASCGRQDAVNRR